MRLASGKNWGPLTSGNSPTWCYSTRIRWITFATRSRFGGSSGRGGFMIRRHSDRVRFRTHLRIKRLLADWFVNVCTPRKTIRGRNDLRLSLMKKWLSWQRETPYFVAPLIVQLSNHLVSQRGSLEELEWAMHLSGEARALASVAGMQPHFGKRTSRFVDHPERVGASFGQLRRRRPDL
jgi:hypothetical protein